MYQPLTLKNTKTAKTKGEITTKRGVVSHNDTSGEDRYTEVPVQVRRRPSERYHVVFVKVPDLGPGWVVAGVVYVEGVGLWGMKTYGVDSKPRPGNSVGYRTSGTLADTVERMVHEFLHAAEEVVKEARKSPEQVAAEAKVTEDRLAALQAVHAFIADDEAAQRDRYFSFLVPTGVIASSDEDNAWLTRALQAYDDVKAATRARRR